jgi:flagellar motor switch protein FliM
VAYSNPTPRTIYHRAPDRVKGRGLNKEQRNAPKALELGQQDARGPNLRLLRSVHATFARELGAGLSALLQSEVAVSLTEVGMMKLGKFRDAFSAPTCLVTLKLGPRQERVILQFDSLSVLGLLELLMGGTGGAAAAAPRELTEIEWSLFEEVIRILMRALSGAWQPIVAVEFEIESLGSDPAALPCPDPGENLIRAGFILHWGEQVGNFELAAPRALFEPAESPAEQEEDPTIEPNHAHFKRNMGILGNAQVELEVLLQGPTVAFAEILALKPGQVITFDYPLKNSLDGIVNGDPIIKGHIVSTGRKRGFQIEQLPEPQEM